MNRVISSGYDGGPVWILKGLSSFTKACILESLPGGLPKESARFARRHAECPNFLRNVNLCCSTAPVDH